MNGFCLALCILSGTIGHSQIVNYEEKAILFFIDSLERNDLFAKSCDCVDLVYFTENKLKVYDSAYLSLDLIFLRSLFRELELSYDSFAQFREESKRLVLSDSISRISLTSNPNDFQTDSYLLRFSDRLLYNQFTVVSFLIKNSPNCSGLLFYFLIDQTGKIIQTEQLAWCDDQG